MFNEKTSPVFPKLVLVGDLSYVRIYNFIYAQFISSHDIVPSLEGGGAQ